MRVRGTLSPVDIPRFPPSMYDFSAPSRPRRSAAAFTLTELLIVIAVIAILAAILLSVFSAVTQNRNKVTCANNLRNISTALNLFSQDNDGRLPGPVYTGQTPFYHDPSMAQYYYMICDYVAPYLQAPPASGKNYLPEKLFVCPSWVSWRGRQPVYGDKPYMVPYMVLMPDGSYYTPFGYPGATAATPLRLPMRISQMTTPSQMALLSDADSSTVPPFAGTVPPKPVHNGKRNYLFADGHIDAYASWP